MDYFARLFLYINILTDIFFSGRINRRNFLIGLIISTSFTVLVMSLRKLYSNNLLIIAIFFALVIIINLFVYSLFVRRLHDLNKSGGWALLQLIPLVGIFLALYLLIKKGDENKNKYGEKPHKNIKFPKDIFLGK